MIRAVSAVPVIVATARDDEAEMVRMLDRGADDYVTKPFSADQLDARIRAVLRRAHAAPRAGADRAGRPRDRTAAPGSSSSDGASLELSRREFDLLWYLAGGRARWSPSGSWWGRSGANRTVVPTARSTSTCRGCGGSLGETAAEPRYLHTVRGVGVKLVAPEQS